MWEAYAVGTIPVGAVVVDEAGEIVSRGRNRILDEVHATQLGRTRLAHAELNALLELSSDRTYEDFTLYTALEPCHLCLSAMYSVRGGEHLLRGGRSVRGRSRKKAHPVTVEGPLPGAAGLLPELLHVAHFLWRLPDSNIMRVYRCMRPDLVEAARALPPPDSGATLAEAVARLPPA